MSSQMNVVQQIAFLNSQKSSIDQQITFLQGQLPVAEPVNVEVPVAEEAAAAEEAAVADILAVFSPVAAHDIKKGRVATPDFKDMVACSYQLPEDLGQIFSTKSEKDFKDHVKALRRCDDGDPIGGSWAKTLHTFMKNGTENIGKKVVVSYDKGCGPSLVAELREITGPYRYAPLTSKSDDRPSGIYFHQFPTKLIRKLTTEESLRVFEARMRQAPRGINWSVKLTTSVEISEADL